MEAVMRGPTSVNTRRGITVLALLLLIIALVVAAVLLVRYLDGRPAVSFQAPSNVISASVS
jgi:hypothetical protein